MVRPRASERNLGVALSFARVVIVKTEPGVPLPEGAVPVAHKGSKSIFAALEACMPDLVRDSRDKRPKNRRGVAAIELNKALLMSGMKLTRKEDVMEGGDRAPLGAKDKVWAHCRWTNPANEGDAKGLAERLSDAKDRHQELQQCSVEKLHAVIERILTHVGDDYDDDGNSEEEGTQDSGEGRQADMARMCIPQLASFSSLPMLSNLSSMQPSLFSCPSMANVWSAFRPPPPSMAGAAMLAGTAAETSLHQFANIALPLGESMAHSSGWRDQPSASSMQQITAQTTTPILQSMSSLTEPSLHADDQHREIQALRAQVLMLERNLEDATKQRQEVMTILPNLLSDRSVLVTDNAMLIAECTSLRAERDALRAEVVRLARQSSGQ